MKHAEWTFFPEVDLVPRPTAFTILSALGDSIDTSVLMGAALAEFQKLPDEEKPPPSGQKQIHFPELTLQMRDESTGVIHKVVEALVVIHYEVIEELIPFKLLSYSNSPSGDLITDAAVADMNLGGVQGKLMIVYKEDAGGQIVFVPEKRV